MQQKTSLRENRELFDKWNKLKKEINCKSKNFYPKSREVWYISVWKNIWFESSWKWKDFKRPILVIKRIGSMFLIVTMTTKWKENKFYYKLGNNYFNKDSYITLSQFKTVDTKRFMDKIWKINKDDFIVIKNKIKKLF